MVCRFTSIGIVYHCALTMTNFPPMDTSLSKWQHSSARVHLGAPFAVGMSDHRIAILPGDGTGREVAIEAMRILDTVQLTPITV